MPRKIKKIRRPRLVKVVIGPDTPATRAQMQRLERQMGWKRVTRGKKKFVANKITHRKLFEVISE